MFTGACGGDLYGSSLDESALRQTDADPQMFALARGAETLEGRGAPTCSSAPLEPVLLSLRPQGGRARRGQSYDRSERGHRLWTHAAAARGRDGEHSGPHGVPEPDRGAHTAGVREHFRQVEAVARRRIHALFSLFLRLSGATPPQIFQLESSRREWESHATPRPGPALDF